MVAEEMEFELIRERFGLLRDAARHRLPEIARCLGMGQEPFGPLAHPQRDGIWLPGGAPRRRVRHDPVVHETLCLDRRKSPDVAEIVKVVDPERICACWVPPAGARESGAAIQ